MSKTIRKVASKTAARKPAPSRAKAPAARKPTAKKAAAKPAPLRQGAGQARGKEPPCSQAGGCEASGSCETGGSCEALLHDLQLEALKLRFEDRRDRIPMLTKLAASQGITRSDEIDDVLPLLFEHTIYKSYSRFLLESGEYAR